MDRISWVFTILLIASSAFAQQAPDHPRWDAGVTAGPFWSNPAPPDSFNYDDWYFEGRYAASIGRYWTTHLKTELEVATSGEGHRYVMRHANVPGVPAYYPITSEEYFRLQQVSGRMMWQFGENSWVHPYVFGGVALDIERKRAQLPEQFFHTTNDPRVAPTRILITPRVQIGPEHSYRAAAIAGIGTKVYMTPNAFFNAAFVTSHNATARAAALTAGLGVDF
ncbi:MAG TPA: hypothetical protein VEC39_19020 [Vicinamibacterales bacterium]|nr:hypothetical protein [Vicinamibacterales bacterium]